MLSEDNFQALGGDFKYQKESQEINWNVQHISASNSCTQDTELRVQKITNLQQIANNLPNPFTGYKHITKSYDPATSVPERVEVYQQNHSTPCSKQEGEKYNHTAGFSFLQATKETEEETLRISKCKSTSR